jgi:hypothetical protein
MFDGNRRWLRLTIMALGNLVLWVAIAALVGLLVSDQMDIGFETELRQVQATAIAAWRGLVEGDLAVPGRSTPLASNPRPTPPTVVTRDSNAASSATSSEAPPAAERPTGAGTGASDTVPEPAATGAPAASVPSTADGPLPDQTAPLESARPGAAGDLSASGTAQGTVQSAGRPSPEPTAILLIRPLLLTDPTFDDLGMLNAEMARSAPGRVVQISYQEDFLSQEIHAFCENKPDLALRNVQAELQKGKLVLTGETTFLGFHIKARVSGTITVLDCRPEIEIRDIAMAGILAPKAIRNQLEQQVLEAMTWYPTDSPLCLEQIVLEESRATIYGYRR